MNYYRAKLICDITKFLYLGHYFVCENVDVSDRKNQCNE